MELCSLVQTTARANLSRMKADSIDVSQSGDETVNAVEPFLIDIPEHQLGDLRSRLARTRWPTPVAVPAWDDGTNLDYLRDLCRYWSTTSIGANRNAS